MNEWTVSYALVFVTLLFGVYRRRQNARLVLWRRVGVWLVLAAIGAMLVWGILGCELLVNPPSAGREALVARAVCLYGATFWSSMMVAVLVPIYGLALAFYALGEHRERGSGRERVVLLSAAAAPVGVALCYGYAFPLHGTLLEGLSRAAAPALLGYLATMFGLAIPRLTFRRLARGALWRADTA